MTTTAAAEPVAVPVKKRPPRKKCEHPARNWAYGARRPASIEDLQFFENDLREQQRLCNVIREFQRERREEVRKLTEELCPELVELAATAEQHKAAVAAYEKLVTQRFVEESRRLATPEEKYEKAQLKAEMSRSYRAWKARRAEVFASAEYKTQSAPIERSYADRVRGARAASPLYWGSKAIVDARVRFIHKGAPPKPQAYRGTGSIGIQLQITKCSDPLKLGLTVAEAFSGTNRYLQIDRLPDDAFARGVSQRLRRAKARIRVGTNEDGSPRWFVVEFYMHRPIPSEARIKYVYLDRFRSGNRYRWQFRLALVFPAVVYPQGVPVSTTTEAIEASRKKAFRKAEKSAVGVDLGWRLLKTGSRVDGLRVATWSAPTPIDRDLVSRFASLLGVPPWFDASGRRGQLVIPLATCRRPRKQNRTPDCRRGLQSWYKIWELSSIIDNNRNACIAELWAWWEAQRTADFPEWFVAQMSNLKAIKSSATLQRRFDSWRQQSHNWPSPPEFFYQWTRQDSHLVDWRENQRYATLQWRDEIYWLFVTSLRRSFGKALVEKINWADLKETPEAADFEDPLIAAVLRLRDVASPGRIKALICETMQTTQHQPAFTTQRCSVCGEIEKFNKAAEVVHICTTCGSIWDQDDNATTILCEIESGNMPALSPSGMVV